METTRWIAHRRVKTRRVKIQRHVGEIWDFGIGNEWVQMRLFCWIDWVLGFVVEVSDCWRVWDTGSELLY